MYTFCPRIYVSVHRARGERWESIQHNSPFGVIQVCALTGNNGISADAKKANVAAKFFILTQNSLVIYT